MYVMCANSQFISVLKSAIALCAEFFADILVDWDQGTIIVNITYANFDTLNAELIKRGFNCVHETVFDDTITCCYIYKLH